MFLEAPAIDLIDLEVCAAYKDDNDRLACYDDLVSKLKAQGTVETPKRQQESTSSTNSPQRYSTNTPSDGKARHGEYWIKVKATPTGPYTVDVEIETNIPGEIVLSANLVVKGQKPDDTLIGTDFIRVPVSGGKAKATIDGAKRTFPYKSKLPAGDYDVEVNFYPRWSKNKAVARAAKISDAIEGRDSIVLSASGQSSSSAKAAAEGKRWVMENFYMGYPWNPAFWSDRFGELQRVEYRGSGNSRVLKMYYVKSIDMTLLINDLKKEIVTYRMGLADQ